jgi:hypothetical protein
VGVEGAEEAWGNVDQGVCAAEAEGYEWVGVGLDVVVVV